MNSVPKTDNAAYDEAIRWVYDRIDYERVRPARISNHFRLERTRQLLELVGRPDQRLPAVHIAGTKGKGSTAAMVHSILHESQLKVGLFTSPHIDRFEERLRVGHDLPTLEEMISLVNDFRKALENAPPELQEDGPTYFEVATLLAWMHFDRCDADLVVLETGLGGRLDCTNVCSPLATIITTIGLDHTHLLGDTLAQIAGEKAGIIKTGVPVLSGVIPREPANVIAEVASQKGCELFVRDQTLKLSTSAGGLFEVDSPWGKVGQLRLSLAGDHQQQNATLAVSAALLVNHLDGAAHGKVTDAAIRSGLSRLAWPLRFETVKESPRIILDAAHNPDSIAAFVQTLKDQPLERPRTLIFASSKDKDADRMLQLLLPEFDELILTEFQTNPRAIPIKDLQQMIPPNSAANVLTAATPSDALARALDIGGTICGTGSIFIAAELRREILGSANGDH